MSTNMVPSIKFIFLNSLLTLTLNHLCFGSMPSTVRCAAQQGRHVQECENHFKSSEMLPTPSSFNVERDAINTQPPPISSQFNEKTQSFRSSISHDTTEMDQGTAYRAENEHKASIISPETNYKRNSHRIQSKASYDLYLPAYHVFCKIQNNRYPEVHPVDRFQHHATSPTSIDTRHFLTTGVPMVHLALPDFVLPGMVPCFLNPQDAELWAALGAELRNPDLRLSPSKNPHEAFGVATPGLVPDEVKKVLNGENPIVYGPTHSKTQFTPQKVTHREDNRLSGSLHAFRPGKQSNLDKETIVKVKAQPQEETETSPEGEVIKQLDKSLGIDTHQLSKTRGDVDIINTNQADRQVRGYIKDKALVSQYPINQFSGNQELYPQKVKDISGESTTFNKKLDTTKDGVIIKKESSVAEKLPSGWLSVIKHFIPKATEPTKKERITTKTATQPVLNSKETLSTSQGITSFQEKEILSINEDRKIVEKTHKSFDNGNSSWSHGIYKDVLELEDSKHKTVDTFPNSYQSTLKPKSGPEAEKFTSEGNDNEGWIKCHQKRVRRRRPCNNINDKGSCVASQDTESHEIPLVENTQQGCNEHLNTQSFPSDHHDEFSFPYAVRKEDYPESLAEKNEFRATLDVDSGGISVDNDRTQASNSDSVKYSLTSNPLFRPNHPKDSKSQGDESLDVGASVTQALESKGPIRTGEKTESLNHCDGEIVKSAIANRYIGSLNEKGDKSQDLIRPGVVEAHPEEYFTFPSLDQSGGSSSLKEDENKKKKIKKKKRIEKQKKAKDTKFTTSQTQLPQPLSQILESDIGKAILETLQFHNKERLLPISLDEQRTSILAHDALESTGISKNHQENEKDEDDELKWGKIFEEFTLMFGDKWEAQRRVNALLAQFSQKAIQIHFKEMRDLISEPLKRVLYLLKVKEEFPLFQDFDSIQFLNFQKLKSELRKIDHEALLSMCSEDEMNRRIHQMSIMARIEHDSILLHSNEMKDFMKQGGSLQIVLEIQHNLGIGIQEKVWKEVEEYKIQERVRNIIYAMLGVSVLQDKPELLWYVHQQWCGTYTREFFFQQPQLSKTFEKRFGMLVEYSDKLKPTKLSDWLSEKKALRVGEMAHHELQWGKVLVGVHCGIPLLYLWHGLDFLHHGSDLKFRPGIKRKERLYWPLNLPPYMEDQFENFKKFFEYFGKHLLLTNKS
ncbi:hypothetical protein DFH28DRAFT_494423 [Melampsora americana]|nr:hypothetical protein DFH28DRAFT_494423 [Melampsora americana]